jgi:UPF0176 protein
MNRLQVAAFYAFTPLNEQQRGSLLSDLPDMANTNNVLGSILVAHEGVNGTISACVRRLPWVASILSGWR